MLGLSSAIGLATTAVGSIWGAIDSKRKADKAMANENARHANADAYYNRELGQDYIQRADIQSLLSKQRELLAEQYKRARATNVVGGGTDESEALQKQLANQALAQTMSSIASTSASRTDALKTAKQAEDDKHANTMTTIYDNQAQRSAQAGPQLAKVGGEFIDADDGSWGWLLKRKRNADETNQGTV